MPIAALASGLWAFNEEDLRGVAPRVGKGAVSRGSALRLCARRLKRLPLLPPNLAGQAGLHGCNLAFKHLNARVGGIVSSVRPFSVQQAAISLTLASTCRHHAAWKTSRVDKTACQRGRS